jgi:peptidoglycan/xylan/chitin deacetylase (PgdA/CDA1 family)
MAETLTGGSAPLATIVMYHFVRPPGTGAFPRLKSLDLGAFRQQLEYLRTHYSPVDLFDLVGAAEHAEPLPPRPVVLTFDDGYLDHHEFVVPLLQQARVRAVFFPVASALLERRVLDVNKIQLILAASGDVGPIVQAIDAAIDRARAERDLPAPAEFRARWWTPSRWDPPGVVYVKRLLQHALPEDVRVPLVDALFRTWVSSDEGAIAGELYMSTEQLRDLRTCGMVVGAHGDRHIRLSTLTRAGQACEIDGALRVLTAVDLPTRRFVYAYANGDHNEDSVRLLRARHCTAAVTTRPDLASITAGGMLELPRIDTNDLPPLAEFPNAWMQRAQSRPA